ncbi:MAG: hypothetical protein PHS71_07290 [Proteiniphilum sp.]|nr:hypothetical protein [Proteiniphilum sp.]MDD4799873.1 hypothetical protein [Proteiniphilum sp.]
MGESSLIQKITKNPAFGLIPMLVFSFLAGTIEVVAAMGAGLLLSLAGFLGVKKPARLIYQISLITFAIAFSLSLCFFTQLTLISRFVIVEIIFVLVLIVARLARTRIVSRSAKKENVLMRNYLKETFRVAFQTQYGLSVHLLLVMAVLLLGGAGSEVLHYNWIRITAQAFLVAVILMESARLYFLRKKLYKEEWLPVVTESGDVTGRVAKSITKDLKNHFMHPVVRVALILNGRIYLQERDALRLLNPGLLDHPFEKYMQYDHDIDESVHNSISCECGNKHLPLRFLLKYTFENETTKRLIFLYVSDIEDEELFNSLHLVGGKLWTEAQIEDNMGTNLFSECFELEFEYLKNTVLLAHRFRKKLENV